MSEQNEREAFDIWISKYNIEKKQSNQTLIWIAYEAWQHQRQRINELEAIIADRTKDIIKTNEMVKSLRDCQ